MLGVYLRPIDDLESIAASSFFLLLLIAFDFLFLQQEILVFLYFNCNKEKEIKSWKFNKDLDVNQCPTSTTLKILHFTLLGFNPPNISWYFLFLDCVLKTFLNYIIRNKNVYCSDFLVTMGLFLTTSYSTVHTSLNQQKSIGA